MPRFCANISMLFCEHDLLDRFQAARDAGFTAIEMQFPYPVEADTLATAAARAGVALVLINAPAGELGGPGLAALPDGRPAFREALAAALRYTEILKPRCINIVAGAPPASLDRAMCLATFADNLKLAAETLSDLGTRVTVEAINDRDWPGFLLPRTDDVMAVIELAGQGWLQADLYHMRMMGEDPVPTLERHITRLGHVQFADVPGRHEPGTGSTDFAAAFAALDRLGYSGYVSAEYRPTGRTVDSLAWLKPYL